jgi:hypothetical protein
VSLRCKRQRLRARLQRHAHVLEYTVRVQVGEAGDLSGGVDVGAVVHVPTGKIILPGCDSTAAVAGGGGGGAGACGGA